MFETDFAKPEAARRTINDWVGGFTEHKIKEVVPAGVLTPQTRVLLASALYFRSAWQRPFQKSHTRDAPFHVTGDKTVTAAMMTGTATRRYLETPEFQACSLGYADGRFAMMLFVPKKVDGLGAFETSLTADTLAAWLTKFTVAEVDVQLPRFQIAGELRLAPALQGLGMKEAFATGADFTGIARPPEGLVLSSVVHSAVIAVDEEGTEAAAATEAALELKDDSAPKRVVADRPFFFLIREGASGAVLFMGRVADPTKGRD
jgi:serpin B